MRQINRVPVRVTAGLGMAIAALAVVCTFASSAEAVVVHVGNGQRAGITPVRGINPASIPDTVVAGRATSSSPFSSNGNVDYHGGPVLHSSTPYLIFWDPDHEFTSADKALFERYFTDVAADSGKSSDVFGVIRQYTDASGFADYQQHWSSSQAITDTDPYPTSGQCTENAGFTETACLYDAQIQAEVQHLITVDGLPDGINGTSATPIYFVITPPDVNSCFSDDVTCADNYYCAYHSNFTDSSSNDVIYADIPTLLDVNDPKGCQGDDTSQVQDPNGNPEVEIAIDNMSHEDNESITDPDGDAWWDSNSGNEVSDNCAFTGSFDPQGGYNPDAYLPTLGGSASAGTLFDQLINGDDYYTQSVWSNGDVNCELQPAPSAISASYSAPAGAPPNTSITFDPSASSSAGGYTSTTWDFGDGSTSFSRSAPTTVAHTYTTAGTYTATLTVVDEHGNISTTSQTLKIKTGAIAAFTSTPSSPLTGTTVSFDASASLDSLGTISSYQWDFGDGTSLTTTTPTITHSYAARGPYTVQLTVSDGTSTDVATHTVKVDSPPVAAFGVTTTGPITGTPVAFDGTGSIEPGGSIASYSWNFGDGSSAGSGASPSHTYTAPGTYTVALTVTDQDGHTDTVSHSVTIAGPPSAAFDVTTASPTSGSAVAFDGTGSGETDGSIASYTWDFGDGTTTSGPSAATTHTYASAGIYTVKLTVADPGEHTATVSHTVTVHGLPSAAFVVSTSSPPAAAAVSFNASGSSEAEGSISSYSWNFGDGSAIAQGVAPIHAFATAGTYAVKLTVTDAAGNSATASRTVTVVGTPSASFSISNPSPLAGTPVSFSGAGSSDLGSAIGSYSWQFGDGATGAGASVSHSYSKPGIYTVTLTVTDGSGQRSTETSTVTVQNPTVTGVSVKKGRQIERITLTLAGPGTVALGSKRFHVVYAGTLVLKVKLSLKQRTSLKSHHSVTLRLGVRFAPTFGNASTKTVTIKIKGY